MNDQIIIAIISGALASSGLWTFIMTIIQNKSATAKMVRGLGHDRIIYLGETYIKRGYITVDEYDNLVNYLYLPYKKLGGNGTAEKIVEDVKKLPIR